MENQEKIKKKEKYKLLLVAPLILFAVSLLGFFMLMQSGFKQDIDLKGGVQISFDSASAVSIKDIESLLKDYDARVRITKGFTGYSALIEVEGNSEEISEILKNSGYEPSVRSVSPALSAVFFRQAVSAMVLAFIFMALVVFIIFRKLLPSSYVVLVAFADILETFVISQFLGIKLSLASFAALLLLIGYSVDTDILLTSRVLKGEYREGKERASEVKEKTKGAMKTGLMMTATTLTAVIVLFFVSSSDVIVQIASMLLIGLSADIVNTWMFNAVVLRWYMERRVR